MFWGVIPTPVTASAVMAVVTAIAIRPTASAILADRTPSGRFNGARFLIIYRFRKGGVANKYLFLLLSLNSSLGNKKCLK